MQEVNSSLKPGDCSAPLRSSLHGKDGNSPWSRVLTEVCVGKSRFAHFYHLLFYHFIYILLLSCDSAPERGFASPGSKHKKLMNHLNSSNHCSLV